MYIEIRNSEFKPGPTNESESSRDGVYVLIIIYREERKTRWMGCSLQISQAQYFVCVWYSTCDIFSHNRWMEEKEKPYMNDKYLITQKVCNVLVVSVFKAQICRSVINNEAKTLWSRRTVKAKLQFKNEF